MGANHKRLSDRAFGFAFATLFMLIFVVGAVFFERIRVWALMASTGFALVALLAPGVLMPLNRIWAMIGERITLVLNLTLLFISYVLVILPLGMIMKLRGRDALRLNPPPGQTYWVPSQGPITRENFQDLF